MPPGQERGEQRVALRLCTGCALGVGARCLNGASVPAALSLLPCGAAQIMPV